LENRESLPRINTDGADQKQKKGGCPPSLLHPHFAPLDHIFKQLRLASSSSSLARKPRRAKLRQPGLNECNEAANASSRHFYPAAELCPERSVTFTSLLGSAPWSPLG